MTKSIKRFIAVAVALLCVLVPAVTLTTATEVEADCTSYYLLKVQVTPDGGGDVRLQDYIIPDKYPATYAFNRDVSMQFEALPAPGYVFEGWSGDASGSEDTVVVEMCGATTVTAVFAPEQQEEPFLTGTLSLSAGWNLLGMPLAPQSLSVEELFDGSSVEAAYTFDSATGTWHIYSPGCPSDLTQIDMASGFWVLAGQSDTLVIEGTVSESGSVTLETGWNLINIPGLNQSCAVEELFSDCAIETVVGYNAETMTWQFYSPDSPSDLSEIMPGCGYWVKVSAPCTITID